MKKGLLLFALIPYLLLFGQSASANTVTINLLGVETAGINIGAFQLFFYPQGVTYQYPLDRNLDTFDSDFLVTWNSGVQPSAAAYDLAAYPITQIGNSLYATGFGTYCLNDTNTNLSLNDGLVVTLSSVNSFFGINPVDSRNAFFDFLNRNAEISNLQISEEWGGGNQTINVSVVPIPAAVWLLGSGVVGLVVLKRRKKA